jgi:hypothetical protein
MVTTSRVASNVAARALLSTVAQGAAAGSACGLVLPALLPGIATLIAAQADIAVARAALFFMCMQIGVAAAVLFAVLDQASDGCEDER